MNANHRRGGGTLSAACWESIPSIVLCVSVTLFFLLFPGFLTDALKSALFPGSKEAGALTGSLRPIPWPVAYYLILGVDDAAAGGADRTDTIGILGIDFDTKRTVFMSIPRDLMVPDLSPEKPLTAATAVAAIPAQPLVKINGLFKKYGIQALQKTIESLFSISIARYAVVDYEVFEYLGDLLGPVKVNIRTTLDYEDTQQKLKIHFEPGIQELDGKRLLLYIRFRNDPLGDLGRIQRQKEVLFSLLQSLKYKKDAATINRLIQEVLTKIDTDLDAIDLLSLWGYTDALGEIAFLNFPYMINAKGEVEISSEKMKQASEEIRRMEAFREPYVPQLILINAWNDNAYQFSIVEYNQWTGQSIRPFIIEKRLVNEAVRKIAEKRDLLCFLTRDAEKQKEISERYQTVYPKRQFLAVYPEIGAVFSFRDYLSVVEALMKAKTAYPFPADAFIFRTHP